MNERNLQFERFSLLNTIMCRRSRRFAAGMSLNSGPLAYRSARKPEPLRVDEEAALAFDDYKYAAAKGTFRDGGSATGWRDPAAVQTGIARYSDRAIDATIACCEYIHWRYGRFPGGTGPFRTVLAYQAHRLDADFYRKFYRDDAWRFDSGDAARGQ